MKKFIGLLLFLFLFSPLFGTDYFVKNGGNDGASGLDDANAWETWGQVKGFAFGAGDTVSFKRGDTWSIGTNAFWIVTLDGNSGNYITVDAYDSGVLPIIDLEETLTGGWTEHDTNIWKKNYGDPIRRCRLDGVDSFYAANIAAVDGITYNWHWASNVLYIYATENPDTAYSSVKITDSNAYAFLIRDATYIKFQNLRILGSYVAFILWSGYDQEYLEINGCDIWYGYRGLWAQKTAGDAYTANNITVDGNDFDAKLNMLTKVGPELQMCVADGLEIDNECDNWTISNNTFTDWGHGAITLYVPGGSPSQGVNNCIIENNIVDGTNSPYLRAFNTQGNTGDCTGNIFRYNIDRNTNVRNQIGGNNNEFYYNLIYHKTESPVTNVSNVSEGLMIDKSEGNACHDNEIYNNIFYDIFNEGLGVPTYANAYGNLIKNNIVMNAGQGGDQLNIAFNYKNGAGVNVIANNCFYDSGTSDVVNYKGTVETVAEADAGRAEFSSNIGSDPKFIDVSGDDFRLLMASPCVNAGTDVGLTRDYRGRSIRHAPDIGAYEDPTNAVFMARLFNRILIQGSMTIEHFKWLREKK